MIPLIVDLETEWRGGQNQALLLLKGLYERGHAAELLAPHGSALAHRAQKAGFYVHHTPRGLLRLPAALEIRSLLRDGRIDLVHANEAHALTASWLAGAQRIVPLVISRRVGYPIARNWLAQARYRAARYVLANSQWVAEQAVASGVPQEMVRVVYEGVEIPALPSAPAREAARQRWRLKQSDRVLGCVGALQSDKGHEWVIRALADLRREFPACKLLIAGDGEYRPRLKTLAAELKVQEQVIFAGFVKDISAVYEALDIFVFPSLFEGLGTSLLSAMGYGIPSITFFGCALGEIVENERSGLQVEAKNSAEIARAVARLLRDPELARKIAETGRARVAKNFSAERMVDETLRVYGEILGGRGGAEPAAS